MKTKSFLLIAILWNSLMFCQSSIKINKSQVRLFAVTPLNYEIKRVNGLALGLGYDPKYLFKDDDLTEMQTVNGLNLEINPLGLLYWLFYDPQKFENAEYIKMNGLNLSLAGYTRGISHNGISISMYNYGYSMNGLMGSLFSFEIEKGKGVFLATLKVSSKEMKGISMAAFNDSEVMRGVQLGLYNRNSNGKGLQLGLVNKSKKMKGLQIGFWNKNEKRTLPIINF
ncbi:LA_2272 family surface repeat-containing protein [Chryseobacterium sp.]|uniref:LA_2272 family surface repeat-containing protein n=1 Tax=Chryseobacterium sp. TaxID=1871047 RepID=UPI00289CB07F|nr:hypothetical protein [Chryseobacterium sp.]